MISREILLRQHVVITTIINILKSHFQIGLLKYALKFHAYKGLINSENNSVQVPLQVMFK